VTFELIAPNMFGSEDDYDKELRKIRKEEKAQKVTVKFESPDGIDVETQRMRAAANVAIRGTGAIKARTRRGWKRFDSQTQGVQVPVDLEERGPLRQLITNAIERIFK